MRRMLVILIGIGIVGAAALLAQRASQAQADSQPPQIIDQTTAQIGTLRLTVTATGLVTPKRQVPLLFESSGVVNAVLVKAGDSVKAGDALARLDSTDLESALSDAQVKLQMQQINYAALTSPPRPQDLAAAQAAVTAAQAALNAASNSTDPNAAQVAQLKSQLASNQLWQAQLQRDIAASTPHNSPDISSLIPAGVTVSPDVINQINQGLASLSPSIPSQGGSTDESLAQAQYGVQIADANAAAAADRGPDAGSVASANAALVQAQQQLNQLENGASSDDLQAAQIALAEAQLAVDQAQAALDQATLVAPFDGVIAQNHLVEGQVPPSGQAAMLLVDTSALYVDLDMDETDVVKVQVGQTVDLSFDALPGADLTGRVTRIGLTPTISGQLVTYPVRVTLDPTDQPVRLGMSAAATILVNELDNVLLLPNRFIRIDRTSGAAFVTVQDQNGTINQIPVQLGLRSDLESQISGGLQAGETVVLLPSASLSLFGG